MVAEHIQHCEQTLMFTDIVGYSRLMGCDETMAVEMLGDYRKILISHIEAQAGQLVEFVGDAIFARFDTATSAVAAAIAIQQHLLAFNEARDKKLPRLQTRIGLHKGEVMLRDGAVFGDSVNIAARLEPLAVADGICISQTVYDEIRITLSSPAKRLGLQALKNIEQKVRVFLIKPSGIGWRDHLHYFLRGLNKNIVTYRYPLTACLLALIAAGVYFVPRWLVPGYAANYVEIADFKNLMDKSGDADYFSAGITSAVRSQLADMRDVYIVDAKEGIHAPIRLEGSVQKLDDNLRISYRLFRRKDNVQIAGGKLDGKYQDIFILQDRLVGEIARYLADEFDLQNFRPAPLGWTNDANAYDYYLRGLEYLDKPSTNKNFDDAIQMFNTALVHDKNFSMASTGICEAYGKKYQLTNDQEWLGVAEKHCLSAIKSNRASIRAYKAIGTVYRDFGLYDNAIKYLTQGLELDRNDASTIVVLASVYDFKGMKDAAEKLYLDAIRLSPKSWEVYSWYGYFLTGSQRYDEAIIYYNKALEFIPENSAALNNIGINYFFKEQFGRAATAFEMAANIDPDSATLANSGNMYYYANNYSKAIELYKKAHQLQPENYQWMVLMGDAYKFMPKEKKTAEYWFNMAIKHAKVAIESNYKDAKCYQYLARSLAYFGDLEKANEALHFADAIDGNSSESYYAHLRVALEEENEKKVRVYVGHLLDSGYSDKLLLADPDLSVLKESKFDDLFVRVK